MSGFLENCVLIARILLGVAAALTTLRLLLGPGAMNRLLAMDYLAFVILGFLILEGIGRERSALLVPAVALALVSFIATVAFGRLIGRREEGGEDE